MDLAGQGEAVHPRHHRVQQYQGERRAGFRRPAEGFQRGRATVDGHPVDLMSPHLLHPLLQPSVLAEAGPSMQRDLLLLTDMIDAAEQAQHLVGGVTVSQLEADRQRRGALLWNFTVLGEAAGQVSEEVKARFPDVAWQPLRLRNRIVHGYWSIDLAVLHTTATT